MRLPSFKFVFLTLVICCQFFDVYSQNWISGFNYRKRITINKSKVTPTVIIYSQGETEKLDLINFPVMIEMTSDDLVHIPGACDNKIQNIEGKDIAFTLAGSTFPLHFQLDYYDAATGKLICWVKVPALSADGSLTTATSLYFYYGSAILHNQYSDESLNTWSTDYTRIWHMNPDGLPAVTKNVKSVGPEHSLIGSAQVNNSNYWDGKIGKAVVLDGNTESFHSDIESSTAITISAWVKLNSIGTEQIIMTNDSTKMVNNTAVTDGYKLKINASGQPVLELYRSGVLYNLVAANPLLTNTWYYINGASSGTDISLFLNGIKVSGKSGTPPRLGMGGSVKVGSSKQNGGFLNGTLDELRIQNAVRSPEWLKTEYTNQINPAEFCMMYEEEYNPASFSKFIGTISNSWNVPSNWSNGIVPSQNAKIIILTGKTLDFTDAPDYVLDKIILEYGATCIVKNSLSINCTALIGKNATVKIEDHAKLKLNSSAVNDGLIISSQTSGTLTFSGEAGFLDYSGNGITKVYALEVDVYEADYTRQLLAPIEVYGQVLLKRGKLITNTNLTLLASKYGNAAIFSVPAQANIVGDVHVQKYISGDFPQPASARGWRLLSSPVYHSVSNGSKNYNLNAFQKAMFITGNEGMVNGFDQSPLNGNTIFTHDQSIAGTLSQKFIPITTMSSSIEFGKGLYVFSRGDRTLPNAYANQVATMPFSNPAGYVIQYSGKIHSGDLTMEIGNRNNDEEGDGFNLIGNPYPAPLQWGDITKVNLSPYIWLFDPLNNSYFVSDDPSTIIPSCEGFFVKVNKNSAIGTIKFTEYSKHIGTSSAARISEIPTIRKTASALNTANLLVSIVRDDFKQDYKVIFDENSDDEVNDQDALKVGEGYVSIAALLEGKKLAIDRRAHFDTLKKIQLYIKGWATGDYKLDIKGKDTFNDRIDITLIDKYTSKSEKINFDAFTYSFYVDQNKPDSQGTDRFSLLFEKKAQQTIINTLNDIIYPNPFTDKLHIKIVSSKYSDTQVIIRNMLGQTVFKQTINLKDKESEIMVSNLNPGVYFVQLVDSLTNRTISTFKVLKREV